MVIIVVICWTREGIVRDDFLQVGPEVAVAIIMIIR